jgi:DNA-binding NarL/FixJ family response regulator
MFMSKRYVLLSGRSVAAADDLYEALQRTVQVIKNPENNRIESILRQQQVDLVIMEVSESKLGEIKIIKKMKQNFPEVEVIVIGKDQDQQAIAAAFAQGAKDAFRRPYRSHLIAERVNVLLGLDRV